MRTTENALTYDSMALCAAATGLPLRFLRTAKRDGCAAGFKHGRVHLKPILEHIFRRGMETVQLSPFEALAQARARREEHRLRREQNEFFDRGEVQDYIQKTFMPVREGVLRMPGDLAPQANPGDPVHAQKILEQWTDDFLKRCRDTITATPPSADNSDSSKSPDDELDEPQNGQHKIK